MSVTQANCKVYADLGFPDAESMQVKAILASRIAAIVDRDQLTPEQTGHPLAIRVSLFVNHHVVIIDHRDHAVVGM